MISLGYSFFSNFSLDQEDESPGPLTDNARELSVESTTLYHRKLLPKVKVGRSAKTGLDTPGEALCSGFLVAF